MNRKRQLKRTTRNLRFRPANYDSPDERTPIKLRSQMKEISFEMTPRSTKTVEEDRIANAQVQWEGLGLQIPGCRQQFL